MALSEHDKINALNAETVRHALLLHLIDPQKPLQATLSHAENSVPVPSSLVPPLPQYAQERAERRRAWDRARQEVEADPDGPIWDALSKVGQETGQSFAVYGRVPPERPQVPSRGPMLGVVLALAILIPVYLTVILMVTT